MNELESQIQSKLYVENEYGYKYHNFSIKFSEEERAWLRSNYDINLTYEDKKTGSVVPVHDMCVSCQVRQLQKYAGMHNKTFDTSKFNVRCNFVPGKLPRGSKALLDEYVTKTGVDFDDALRYFRSSVDPVAWLELMFGFRDEDPAWHLRPYQKEQQRCTALRYVLREGRRAGKSFSVACKLIYLMFNHPVRRGTDTDGTPIFKGPRILVITPYQSQITNIFDEIQDLIGGNQYLAEKVTTSKGDTLYVKTPYYHMDFDNGGSIKGFVSGVGSKKDGSSGGTIRGQTSDIIYLDEMDMIPEDVMNRTIQPLLASNKGVMLFASSTPIGRRSKFFDYCTNRPDFKEDYLPTTVLPQWEDIKHEVLADNTDEAFESEYMASFIEGSSGVFKPGLVYDARQDYVYRDAEITNAEWWRAVPEVRDRSELMICLGIDWNKNAGTEFVVVAYDPNQSLWITIDAVNISQSKWTSLSFKEEVKRLNYKWKPDYIYADEGWGHTIIEDIKYEAFQLSGKKNKNKEETETCKLLDRLKSFNFSSTVDLRSPVDGTLIQRTGKEFLVENAIRIFEDKKIWFPEDDETLLKQLLNYSILRRHASTGRPVYGPTSVKTGDHRLDALMLALGGLYLERSIYSESGSGITQPTYAITREQLEERDQGFSSATSRAVALLDKMEKAGVGANLLVTEGTKSKPDDSRFPDILTLVTSNRENQGNKPGKPRSMPKQESGFLEEYKRSTPGISLTAYETDQEDKLQNHDDRVRIVKRKNSRRHNLRRRR